MPDAEMSSGAHLVKELSRDGDPYSLTFLISLAGNAADQYEQLSSLLNGDRNAWLEVKIGAKTVEVIVTDVMRRRDATAEQLRKLLATITAQRAQSPQAPNGNGDLAGLE